MHSTDRPPFASTVSSAAEARIRSCTTSRHSGEQTSLHGTRLAGRIPAARDSGDRIPAGHATERATRAEGPSRSARHWLTPTSISLNSAELAPPARGRSIIISLCACRSALGQSLRRTTADESAQLVLFLRELTVNGVGRVPEFSHTPTARRAALTSKQCRVATKLLYESQVALPKWAAPAADCGPHARVH